MKTIIIGAILSFFICATAAFARTPTNEEVTTIQKVVKKQLANDLLNPDSYSNIEWSYVVVTEKNETRVYFKHIFSVVSAGNIKKVCLAYGNILVEENGTTLSVGNRPYKYSWGADEKERYNFKYMAVNGKFKAHQSDVLTYKAKRSLGGEAVD